jgi:murein DD-endopeptidase MepM/ murein hydrolase activator NlpD
MSTASGNERRERLMAKREAALHRPVLARQLSEGFNGRWSRRQWAQASLFATIGLLVAAIVPGFNPQTPVATNVPRHSMTLPLPPLPVTQRHGEHDKDWQIVRVERGQTLGRIFEEHGISAATMHRLLEHPGVRPVLSRLKPGAEIGLDMPAEGELRALRFDRDDIHRVELALVGDEVRETVVERPVETRTVVISGEVGRSLFHSARKLGLGGRQINMLTDEIFKYDIDFNQDVTAKDRFSVVVEQTWREGELISTGPVLAATFTARGKLHSGFRFERNGKAEYFTADGRSLRKSFIRMPIAYARLTSGFGARRHPVLGKSRMHKGVDYAAGTGTPIMAAGDARVAFVGWKGGYGRTVILDHGRGYTTLYAHMSKFGKYKAGQRISQGSVIGYVGSSGLSTGPHLHYEFRVNGVHRNPLSITMPPPDPLSGATLAQFRAQTRDALERIRKFETLIYADVDGNDGADERVATKSERKSPTKA